MKFYTVASTAAAQGAWPDRLGRGPMSQREMTRAFLSNAHGWLEKEDADVLEFVGKLVELGFVMVDEIDLMKLVRTIAADAETLGREGFLVLEVTVPSHYATGMGYNYTVEKDDYNRHERTTVWDEYSQGVKLSVDEIGNLPGCGYRLAIAGRG